MCRVDCSVLFLLLRPPFRFPGFRCDLVSSRTWFLFGDWYCLIWWAILLLVDYWIFFLDCYYGRLGVRKYYVFRVPALGDQIKCQIYCVDLSAENQGFSWEMCFNLNFSIDDGCTGCRIILFKSICEDMDIVGIFFFNFLEFFWVGGFFVVFTETQVCFGGYDFPGGCFE